LANWPNWTIGTSVNGCNFNNLPMAVRLQFRWWVLKIQRSEKTELVFILSGQMDEEAIAGLQSLIRSEASGRRIALDLRDLTLVNEDGVIFLESCESNGITLENCPAYVREWITRQRDESSKGVRE
jgi:hypothetical protein